MELKLFCAQCSNMKTVDVDTDGLSGTTTVQDLIARNRWISQQNGSHLDIYCSKKCAQ
jgi:hypothetical protein